MMTGTEFLLAETEEHLKDRIKDVHPAAAEYERLMWETARMKYEQTERMIAALGRLALALEKGQV